MKAGDDNLFEDLKAAESEFVIEIFVNKRLQHRDEFELLHQESGVYACEAGGVVDAPEDDLGEHDVDLRLVEYGRDHLLEDLVQQVARRVHVHEPAQG